ncbi:MAG: L-threonylcarbamoyladenylate synthase [Patescibacteria group bacterium]
MNINFSEYDKEVNTLKKGGVGIMPTDTLYGIVSSALNKEAVERIYSLKKRNKEKPLIVLISSWSDLKIFLIDKKIYEERLKNIWPGKVSVILPSLSDDFSYLHRGIKKIAFRMPEDQGLRDFIGKTGPLVAPSANLEGENPVKTIDEAKVSFQDGVDFYIDGGFIDSLPSTLISFDDENNIVVKREGVVIIKN